MNNSILQGKRVAILAADGFEQSELFEPLEQLRRAGAEVDVVSPKRGEIQGFKHFDKGRTITVDRSLAEADPADYDALVLPGGLFSPDQLRTNRDALRFTEQFFEDGKPVGAICHGPWVLINADLVGGRTMTSWPAIRKDIENAGGEWIDEEVVVDHGLVTSRSPKDLDAFCEQLVEEIGEGMHAEQRRAANQ